MISDELVEATRQLWKNVEKSPGHTWSPWASIPAEVREDMLGLLSVLLTQCKFGKGDRMIIPIRQSQSYRELAILTSVAPWSELIMLTENGSGLTLNDALRQDDLDILFAIHAAHSFAID